MFNNWAGFGQKTFGCRAKTALLIRILNSLSNARLMPLSKKGGVGLSL
jgi:hypothetical protein